MTEYQFQTLEQSIGFYSFKIDSRTRKLEEFSRHYRDARLRPVVENFEEFSRHYRAARLRPVAENFSFFLDMLDLTPIYQWIEKVKQEKQADFLFTPRYAVFNDTALGQLYRRLERCFSLFVLAVPIEDYFVFLGWLSLRRQAAKQEKLPVPFLKKTSRCYKKKDVFGMLKTIWYLPFSLLINETAVGKKDTEKTTSIYTVRNRKKPVVSVFLKNGETNVWFLYEYIFLNISDQTQLDQKYSQALIEFELDQYPADIGRWLVFSDYVADHFQEYEVAEKMNQRLRTVQNLLDF